MHHSPWRADFPALENLHAEGQVYLDTAATAQKPRVVLECLQEYYLKGVANVHRAAHEPARRTTEAFEATRRQLAHWLNAQDDKEIIFTKGATEALNLLAYGLEPHIHAGDDIVLSALEHHANLLPWQQLAKRRGARLVVLPLTVQGSLDLEQAQKLIGPKTRILAISQLSNVLGCWLPLEPLLALAKSHNAWTIVDGAQGIVHRQPDMQRLGCDFYVFSGHKLYGPEGVGVLYGRHQALAQLHHWQFGGEMVDVAGYHRARFRPAPLGFEAGTPPIASVLGLGAAISYLCRQDPLDLHAQDKRLHQYLDTGLRQRTGIRILGQPETALISIQVPNIHTADLGLLLADQGIAVRTGSHCAQPLMEHLKLSGTLRISLGIYTDTSDLIAFFKALDNALELLQ